jgi:hypothetical protein
MRSAPGSAEGEVMSKRLAIALLSAALFAASISVSAAADHRVFAIEAQNGSGIHGTVTLTAQGEKTLVELALVGTGAGASHPAHVHPGPCAKLDPKPTYPLAPVIGGVSVTEVNAPIDTLAKANVSINVHESADKIANYVACGDL